MSRITKIGLGVIGLIFVAWLLWESVDWSEITDLLPIIFLMYILPTILIHLIYLVCRRFYLARKGFWYLPAVSFLLISVSYLVLFSIIEPLMGTAEAESKGFAALIFLFSIPVVVILNVIIQGAIWSKYYRKGSVIKTK